MGSRRPATRQEAPKEEQKQERLKHCVLCNELMELVTLRAEGIECEGYRCTSCGNEVVTLEQMKTYGEAVRLREALPMERKVVRLGNSVGITLPKAASRFGLKAGSTVRITCVKESGFYIELVRKVTGSKALPKKGKAKVAA